MNSILSLVIPNVALLLSIVNSVSETITSSSSINELRSIIASFMAIFSFTSISKDSLTK